MKMKVLRALTAAATLGIAGAAAAGVVAPGDVAFEDGAVAASLTGKPGDPAKGREWFKGRKAGNCLACHVNKDLSDESFHGEIGPALDGVADRYTEAELRGLVINAKATFEDSIMPSFYRVDHINRPLKKFAGKTILTAEQVEDVVAYLKTLEE